MEPYLSQNDLEKIYRKSLRSRDRGEIQATADRPPTLGPKPKHSVFLCHSLLDRTIIDKMILLFNKLDVPLYIDWMDDNLPSMASKDTAIMIKKQIEHCHKFLFLATYNALRSKWCNWELGLAFDSKSDFDFAVLPISSRTGKWLGNEYLDLYPLMEIRAGNLDQLETNEIHIRMTNGNRISFTQWMGH